jgi:nucleoside-diphosphate-sugar epimerase
MDDCLAVTKDVDFVFHLAASVGGIQYITEENVGGLTPSLLMNTNMLEAARICDVERFLFTSSACVYRDRGEGLNRFKEEDAIPANPLTTYGWVKIIGEIQCKSYHQDYGIKCSAPRIFNAYGEKENLDPRWSHVIPSLIRKAILYPKEGFTLFGDGNQERAFLYIEDCVEGLLLNMEKVTNAEPVNLGSDELISIGQLAKKIVDISGKDIEIEYDLSGPRGTNKYSADTTRMEQVLGWKPKTSLKKGLERTYKWAPRRVGCTRVNLF